MKGAPERGAFRRTLRDVLGTRTSLRDRAAHPGARDRRADPRTSTETCSNGKTAGNRHGSGATTRCRLTNDEKIGVGVRDHGRLGARSKHWQPPRRRIAVAVLAEAARRWRRPLGGDTSRLGQGPCVTPRARFADGIRRQSSTRTGYFRARSGDSDLRVRNGPRTPNPLSAELGGRPEGHGPGRCCPGEAAARRTISDELLALDEGAAHNEILHQLGNGVGEWSSSYKPRTHLRWDHARLLGADRIYDGGDLEFLQGTWASAGRRGRQRTPLHAATENSARGDLVVEHVADGVLLVDPDEIIRIWNRRPSTSRSERCRETLGGAGLSSHRGDDRGARGEGQPGRRRSPSRSTDRELWL